MTTPEKSNISMVRGVKIKGYIQSRKYLAVNIKKAPFSFRQLRYLAHLIHCSLSFSHILISSVVKVSGFFFCQTVNSFVYDLCH